MNEALTNDYLYRKVPSIFTSEGAERTSNRYQHISTFDICEGLKKEGFQPVYATQCQTRSQAKKAFTKHLLRFRHENAIANDKGLYPELVLINSHDGLSSYRLMSGIYRIVCGNGLIAGTTYNEVRVRHQGDILGNVIEGTYEVIKDTQKMLENSENMSGIILNNDEKQILAESVHQLRFDGQTEEQSGIKASQFLTPRRYQEVDKHDLFTLFNIAQENVIKGGLSGYAVKENGRYTLRKTGQRVEKVKTREIKSIDQSTLLNRSLWSLAEKMAQLKQAS